MKDERSAGFLSRLAAAERRLLEHAGRPLPRGLTDPDPGASERWEAGQVWAHLAEFPDYWADQIRAVLDARAAGAAEPIPFGRTKADPGRIGAIERERRTDPGELLRRVTSQLAAAGAMLRALPPAAWTARGQHPTLGEMTVTAIVERFLVSHLEEHADQLDGLALVTLPMFRA